MLPQNNTLYKQLPSAQDSRCSARGACAVLSHGLEEGNNRMKSTIDQLRALIACGVVLFTIEASATNVITSFPKALTIAREQEKPIFIYLFDSF